MTTKRQIKALAAPLLARNPGLALVGSYSIWFPPTGNVVREIIIDRSSDPDRFQLRWHLTECFLPEGYDGGAFGRCSSFIFRTEARRDGWLWSDSAMADDFVVRCERDVIPILEPLDTDRKRLEFARSHPGSRGRYGWTWHLMTEIALGNLDDARAIWLENGAFYEAGHIFECRRDQKTYDRYRQLGPPLLADDRAALMNLLRVWITENAVGSRHAAFWTREPLPIEDFV
ncbi:hypothetical protein [Methylobacterium sp. J-068]|uniref:hypothetical protein n=1 Tax=Methylobacterium sp. J-068 TaxID=2836649 RepID=UPI001FB89B9A|nr:hypothetical protein [Methylobacterium sp. J-068]MCJ2036588.1 hypothetical protein [Methylobacterium sp. J-068]